MPGVTVMNEAYLEVTFRHGQPLAAYYYLPRRTGDRAVRTARQSSGLIVDYARGNRAIGIEITAPSLLSLAAIWVTGDWGHAGGTPEFSSIPHALAGPASAAFQARAGTVRAGGYTRAVGRLGFDADALTRICARHRIKRLSLFGSVLKGTNRPESDIDLLVEFEPGATPGLLRLASIAEELSALLGGRRVDLRTPHDLSRHFRDEVVRTAEVQFAR